MHEDREVSNTLYEDLARADYREEEGDQGSLGWTYSCKAPGEGLCQLCDILCTGLCFFPEQMSVSHQ